MAVGTIAVRFVGRNAHNQGALAVAIDVEIPGTFVIAHRTNQMPLPGPGLSFGILEPDSFLSRPTDHDHVGPAIVIHIVGEANESVAVAVRIEFVRLRSDDLHLPIGRGVIDRPHADVELVIVIEIADGDTLAAEFRIELRSLEANLFPGGGHGRTRIVGRHGRALRCDRRGRCRQFSGLGDSAQKSNAKKPSINHWTTSIGKNCRVGQTGGNQPILLAEKTSITCCGATVQQNRCAATSHSLPQRVTLIFTPTGSPTTAWGNAPGKGSRHFPKP